MGYGHGVVIRHGFARERGVRKVFSNDMVAHVWAQQNQGEGQNHKGTLWFRGPWLYSYHTAIARFVDAPNGEKIMLIRDEKFSVSTSQHMPSPRVYAGRSFCVPFIGSCEGQTRETWTQSMGDNFHAANLRVFVDRWNDRVAAERKRAPHVWREDLERRVSGYYWSGEEGRPANIAEAAARYESGLVDSLMEFRQQCADYAAAFALALPQEFASESEARELATIQAREVVARFERILNDPKNKARREQAEAKREAKAKAFALAHVAKRAAWLATPDSELLAQWIGAHTYGGGPRAPSIPYWKHTGGLTKAQTRQAEQIAREMEAASGDDSRIREKEARLEHTAQAERRELERQAFEAWKRGESNNCPRSYARDARGGAYLRRVERDGRDLIQTSQGAEVLFADAVRLFKFAKLIRSRCYFPEMSESDVKAEAWKANGSTLRVSHFQLSTVYVDGSCRVGCHFLTWERIAEAAQACGVFDLPAEDTTSKGGRA